jgi:hypothetical protein
VTVSPDNIPPGIPWKARELNRSSMRLRVVVAMIEYEMDPMEGDLAQAGEGTEEQPARKRKTRGTRRRSGVQRPNFWPKGRVPHRVRPAGAGSANESHAGSL